MYGTIYGGRGKYIQSDQAEVCLVSCCAPAFNFMFKAVENC